MKKQTILILILLTTLFIGCDDLEQTVDYKLPYVEKLVIQSKFGIYSTNIAVSVTKTLPPLEEVILEKVTIKDAECKVYFKDTVVDLVYVNGSDYVSEGRLDLEEGVEYKLEVKWKDKFATATTTIPRLPKIKSIRDTTYKFRFYDENIYLFNIEALDKGMIGVWDVNNNFEYNDNLVLINNVGSNYSIGYSYYDYQNEEEPSYFIMKFYDVAYYPYYVTRSEGQSESGIFSGGGLNIEGNVEGENAFGVWIGYNSLTDSVGKYLVE